jgi:hypothetical protein
MQILANIPVTLLSALANDDVPKPCGAFTGSEKLRPDRVLRLCQLFQLCSILNSHRSDPVINCFLTDWDNCRVPPTFGASVGPQGPLLSCH